MLAIYCRISREKELGKDRSIDDQKKIGIELAKSLQLPYKVFIDEGISGTLPIDKRPEFSNLLDEIENNKITHLYAYDQSRLERSTQTRLILNKILKDNDIKLFTESGEVDLHNDEVEMLGDVMSAFNSYFVRQTKKKIKSVLKRRVKDGKAHSSILPYGYKKDINGYLAIDEEEAVIVIRVYDLSLKGIGTNKIAEIFNNEGILTRYNKIGKGTITTINKYTKEATTTRKKDINWSGNSIRGIIKNTIYKGERNYSGEVFNAPIIINSVHWKNVNDNLAKNRNNSGKNVEHKYLLKGKLICGRCGRNYYGKTRVSKKDNYYMCSSKRKNIDNCGNRGINIPIIENLIWQRFFIDDRLKEVVENHFKSSNTDTIIYNLNNELDALNKELEMNTNQRKKAVKLAISGLLSEEDIKPEIKRIDRAKLDVKIKIDHITEQLETYNNAYLKTFNLNRDLARIKKETSFNDKKEIINKYIHSIGIEYDEDIKSYMLGIKFNIPDTPLDLLILPINYLFAWDLVTQNVIPVSKDFDKIPESKIETYLEYLKYELKDRLGHFN